MAGEKRGITKAGRPGLTGTGILVLALSVVGSPSTVSGQAFEEFPVPIDESGSWAAPRGRMALSGSPSTNAFASCP
jgi:hypothetical protein